MGGMRVSRVTPWFHQRTTTGREPGDLPLVGTGTVSSDRWLSGQKQQTVNLPIHVVYGGSNPPLSTMLGIRNWTLENGGPILVQFLVSKRSGGGSNSVVESQPSKLLVAGSIPVSRSTPSPIQPAT